MPAHKNNALPNLDLLRASAVLFVLVDHTVYNFGRHTIGHYDIQWLGRIGVLFFFVHTCWVLMLSLDRHRGEGFFTSFYLRRLFRIYPLSILAVLITLIPPHTPALTHAQWIANLALIQNLVFSPYAFGTIWSLPLEVQMYLFLPFLFLLARRLQNPWPLFAIWLLSLPLALWQPGHVDRASVLGYVPAFLPGVLAYWVSRRTQQRLPAWGAPILIAALTLALFLHPGWTYPAWTTCMALGLLLPLFGQLTLEPLNRVTFQLAKYSYGIYLSHSLLLIWIKPTWTSLPVYLLCVALASIAAYHLVEYPMMRLGQRLIAGRFPPVPAGLAHQGTP